ncbi:hypothetical protein Hdeb2414_s0002g00061211 [Helianthus debilis subsp. tardiflorus]
MVVPVMRSDDDRGRGRKKEPMRERKWREIEIRGGEATASPSAATAGLAGVNKGGGDSVFSGWWW